MTKAAYAPGDPRAIQPGPSADEAPEPAPTSERRIIGNGPLVLSRGALSHWESYKTLNGFRLPGFERTVGPETAAALAQFKRNLAELGHFREWWVPHLKTSQAPRLKPGVPELLLRGLLLDLRHLKALLQQLPVMLDTREKAFVQALEAMGRVEILRREEKEDEMATVLERLGEAVDRRGLDLSKPLSLEVKKSLAAELNAPDNQISARLSDLRRKRDIPAPSRSDWLTIPPIKSNGHAAPAGNPAEKLSESEALPEDDSILGEGEREEAQAQIDDYEARAKVNSEWTAPDSNVEKSSEAGKPESFWVMPTTEQVADKAIEQLKAALDEAEARLATEAAAREAAESKCRELEAERDETYTKLEQAACEVDASEKRHAIAVDYAANIELERDRLRAELDALKASCAQGPFTLDSPLKVILTEAGRIEDQPTRLKMLRATAALIEQQAGVAA